MMKNKLFFKLFSLFSISILTTITETKAAVGAGDIAVIGWNSDPSTSFTKDFSVVVLSTISAGETIYITDKGIVNGAFQADIAFDGDGYFSWLTTTAIPAGTVIKFTVTGGSSVSVISSPNVGTLTIISGWTGTNAAVTPFASTSGDQIIIFQGSIASPTFIYAFHASTITTGLTVDNWNTGTSTGRSFSERPNTLTTGTTAISFGTGALNNYVYKGTLSGTKAQILAAISNPNSTNWDSNDGTAYDLTPGGTRFTGTNPIFTIGSANNAPTDLALSATSINENVAANSIVGALTTTDPDASNTFTYTLVTGTGDTDNASFNISGGNLRITSSPNFEVKNSYTVRIRTTDQGSLTYEEAFTITINNVNEAPTDIALSATSINENVAANSTVGTLSTTDIDASNTFTYTLVTGTGDTDNASFNISGGNLRITSSPNFEVKNSYTVRLRTTDQGSLIYEEALTITINNVNETPTDIALSATSINENLAANSTVGALSTTDIDASNTFTYTLVAGTGDTDNASFNISGSNLRITNSPNFEVKNSYTVRLRTTDQGSLTYEEAFTVTVNNVNETPTDLALSATAINENVAANFTVGTLSTTDVDASNTFTYTLVAGIGDTDNASFNISGSNLRITNSPNFEVKNSYTVRLRTTDQGSLIYEEAFTITINNVNEAPTVANAIPNQSASENQAFTFQFAANTFTDVDASTTLAYTTQLNGGGALPSWLSFNGATRTFSGTPLNANIGTVTIDVIANDGSGGTITAIFNIVVGAPLPVTLNQYAAKLQTDGIVLLTWDTFSEQNNDYFEVSRSTDGQNFVVIGTLKGNGISSQRNLYSYSDRTPKSGDNYYKLVQVDLDGTREELGIRSAKVTLTNEAKVMIYPNPTVDLVNVSFKPGEFINAYLFDLSGKVLIRKAITQQNESLYFDLSDLPSSIYLIRLEGDEVSFSKQIIKK